MAQRTASTHRTSFLRDTFRFHIVGYSSGAARSSRSNAYHAGGHTWALICGFGDHDQLTSISLELLSTNIASDVVAVASLRIDDPHGQRPPAVWRSDVANVFPAWPTASAMATCRSWTLSLPDAFQGQEASYVKDDGLMIQCTMDVLVDQDLTPTAREKIVSVVPPPTISQDLHKLLLLEESETEPETRSRCLIPDVTFVVEETKIQAHKLVLAMRSPVLAAQLYREKKEGIMDTCLKVEDMSPSTFRAMLRFIYTDELPIKPSNKIAFTSRACKDKSAARRRAAMARDLLVAAERYGLKKLRLMCQKILFENSDAMQILTIDRGRSGCEQFQTSCIDYTATSSPNTTGAGDGAPIIVPSSSTSRSSW
jgi:speckle-type POZ protein